MTPRICDCGAKTWHKKGMCDSCREEEVTESLHEKMKRLQADIKLSGKSSKPYYPEAMNNGIEDKMELQ